MASSSLPSKKSPFGAAIAPLLFLVIILFLKAIAPELYRDLTYENALFEWLQVGFLLLGSLAFLSSAHLVHVFLRNLHALGASHLLLGLGLIFLVLEEISWGQWLFDRELSPFFREHNTQRNITLHNLSPIQPHLHSGYIALSFLAAALCWLHPVLRAKRLPNVLLSLLPERWLTLYFLPLGVFYLYGDWISPWLVSTGMTAGEVSFDHTQTFLYWSDQEALEVPFAFGIMFHSFICLRRILSTIEASPTSFFFWRHVLLRLFSERYILSAYSIFLCYWFRDYFTSSAIPSVDLPSFISGVELLQKHLPFGRLAFYDSSTFGGWTPFLLYGVVPSIFVACLSWAVDFLTTEPARLASHLTLVFGCALFPWSFLYAVKPLLHSLSSHYRRRLWTELVSTLSVIAYSFWFLNHDHQWFGIGAAAPMNIGLISQLFAWHFLLLYFGTLIRITTHQRASRPHVVLLSVSLGLLISTHILSAAYALFFGGLTILLSHSMRRTLCSAHLLGFGVSAFWFLPFLKHVGEIAPLDIHRPSGDFLELFFRYPMWGVLQTIRTSFTEAEIPNLHPIYFLNTALLFFLFSNPRFRREGTHHTTFLIILCSLLFFSSGFIASSLQVGFHYYRFLAYAFLFLTVLFASLPPLLLPRESEWSATDVLLITLTTAMLVVCCIQSVRLPHYEREMIQKLSATNYLFQEDTVVRHFSSLPKKGRIYVEYLNNYKKFPKLSAHYLASRLPKEAGFEVLPNSHLQEAPAYRMIAGTARLLGANTYNVPLLFTDNANLSKQELVKQLRDFGITHVVAGTKSFIENLMEFAIDKKRIGRYVIFSLEKEVPPAVEPVNSRTLIGYRDSIGNAPFHLVQYYFYSRSNLYNKYELIHLPERGAPVDVPLILMNTSATPPATAVNEETLAIQMSLSNHYSLEHYEPHYPHNRELDAYKKIEHYLDHEFQLENRLEELPADKALPSPLEPPHAEWSNQGQTLALSHLQPGAWYRAKYTYSSLWRSKGVGVFRGMGERMYFVPAASSATLNFSIWNASSSWIGVIISAFSLIFLLAIPCDTLLGRFVFLPGAPA